MLLHQNGVNNSLFHTSQTHILVTHLQCFNNTCSAAFHLSPTVSSQPI